MSAKHTRGPWEIKPEEFDRNYDRIRGGRLGCRYKIANVCLPEFQNPDSQEIEESRANARLIAAAPDLLEALKITRDRLIFLGLSKHSEAVKTCDAAIAKAEGGGQ